jgi:hypothetical protein
VPSVSMNIGVILIRLMRSCFGKVVLIALKRKGCGRRKGGFGQCEISKQA